MNANRKFFFFFGYKLVATFNYTSEEDMKMIHHKLSNSMNSYMTANAAV